MRLLLAILLMFCGVLSLSAQKVKTVTGDYTYHVPESQTIEQAKATALERARIQALASAFGTIVSQTNITNISTTGTVEVDFQTIGMSEVKGEWLEDTDAPVYDISFVDGMFTIYVSVKGKARELVSSTSECVAHVLCNGKSHKHESDRFIAGDQIYLMFQSTTNGFLAVYLSDGTGTVSCLLPYPSQTDASFPIKGNRSYLLFDSTVGDEYIEEYCLTASRETENDIIYIIFSPRKFTKALDSQTEGELLPRELPENEFHKWLTKCRRRDPEMQIIRKFVTITNR